MFAVPEHNKENAGASPKSSIGQKDWCWGKKSWGEKSDPRSIHIVDSTLLSEGNPLEIFIKLVSFSEISNFEARCGGKWFTGTFTNEKALRSRCRGSGVMISTCQLYMTPGTYSTPDHDVIVEEQIVWAQCGSLSKSAFVWNLFDFTSPLICV